MRSICRVRGAQLVVNLGGLKGIVQPFELGGETRLIRSAVKY
jgi:hypothetical protein